MKNAALPFRNEKRRSIERR